MHFYMLGIKLLNANELTKNLWTLNEIEHHRSKMV